MPIYGTVLFSLTPDCPNPSPMKNRSALSKTFVIVMMKKLKDEKWKKN